MYLVTCITANPAEYFYWLDKKKMLIFFTVEHQHSSLRLNYTFLNTFPQNPVFSDWVSVFKRERTVWNTSLHPPLSPSLPLSLPRCLPLQSSSRPALLSAAMAAEAAGRDDATAGPADCTEMGERVRCFFCLFFFFQDHFGCCLCRNRQDGGASCATGPLRAVAPLQQQRWRETLQHRSDISQSCCLVSARL